MSFRTTVTPGEYLVGIGKRQMRKGGKCNHCPRCGGEMRPEPVRNALSRNVDVYICSDCGLDEALMDMGGKPPLPFEKWYAIKQNQEAVHKEGT